MKLDFNSLGLALENLATNIWNSLKPLAAQLIPMVEATAEEVAVIALNAVAQQAPLVLAGKVKLSNATSTVITGLASQGKSIAAANAEAAVQATYNFLAAKLNPQAVTK